MRQISQNLNSGATELVDVPAPKCIAGGLLIATRASLLSVGTERMLIEFGKSSILEKARKQPEKVKQVLEKVKTDGLLATVEAVRAKLNQPIPLGYCNVGTLLETQAGVIGSRPFVPGARIVSNGPHAEVVTVPRNLCAIVPDEVADEEAAFTVVGAIALQGVRLLNPTVGECITVTGLGLIGLLAVQILRANGCRVLGIDFDPAKCKLAEEFGAATVVLSQGGDPIQIAAQFSRGRGMDGVLISASTQSNEPVRQAAIMSRKRGRIVLVGVAGLELSRADFYEKELSFQVSCSYGPGRYDDSYESKGNDYPVGFVRWTEQRNFEAVLDLIANRQIHVRPLISHRFPFSEALKGYELIGQGKGLGIVLDYDAAKSPAAIPDALLARVINIPRRQGSLPAASSSSAKSPTVGLIGAGNFSGMVLLPALAATGARLKTIASAGGFTGTHLGRKFGFALSTTETESIFEDREIDTVIISTRHNTHASLVLRALKSGKHIYVEKPLCLTPDELQSVGAAYREALASDPNRILTVGFNRRFSPHGQRMASLLRNEAGPKTFIMTVNAGFIPVSHWTHDRDLGGGRIIGEGCHYIDLLRFLAGAPIVGVVATVIQKPAVQEDVMTIVLEFNDGSHGTIHYLANGHKSFPKERLEVFSAGKILQLDNFRCLKGFGWPGFSSMKLWRQDKGHKAEMNAFISAVASGGPAPIPFDELVEVTSVSFEAVASANERLRSGG